MKRVSIKDVAEAAGVSTATVSYVINARPDQTISPETSARVLKAVRELNYIPNSAASSLKSKKTNLIGLVIPQTEPGKEFMFSNPFYGDLLSSIEYSARREGYHILLSAPDNGQSYITIARNRGVDGIIIVGAYPNEWLDELHSLSIPVVLIDTYVKDPVYHTVGIDDRLGGRMATEYLLSRGHRDIAFLSGQIEEHGVVHKRFQGYKDALESAGLPVRDEYLYTGSISFEYAEQAAREMVAKGCRETAVFATADVMGVGLIGGLHNLGVRVPDDISVIGFDDGILAKMCNPRLTTIHQDIAEKGVTAIRFIMDSISGATDKQEKILPLSVVERQSVRRI
ncbi:MAG: LacI family transcriptional regulator [Clostridia bacterium]|nr:LacI family transcriptional regulator [Clostridia bacterium]